MVAGCKCPVCGRINQKVTWVDIARFEGDDKCFRLKADGVEYLDDMDCFNVIDKVHDIIGSDRELYLLSMEPQKFSDKQISSLDVDGNKVGATCVYCKSVI